MRTLFGAILAALCLGHARPAVAQDIPRGRELMRHVRVLAHDSMGGRLTPSPGLERAARYVADRFREAGLRPAGDEGSFLQRFEILTTRLDPERAGIHYLTSDDGRADSVPDLRLGRELQLVWNHGIPWEPAEGPVTVLTGRRFSPERIDGLGLGSEIVLIPHPTDEDGGWRPGLGALLDAVMGRADPPAILVVTDEEARLFARGDSTLANVYTENAWDSRKSLNHGVFEARFATLRPLLSRASMDRETAFGSLDDSVTARRLPGVRMRVEMPRTVLRRRSAANVIGLLRGRDAELRDEHVVVLAHYDHLGVGAPDASGDSIYNGADDNASGTAILLELAESLATAGSGPRRSVILLATAGEETGLQGSEWFTLHPPVPLERITAAVNMDGLGRAWFPDTVAVIGREDSWLGEVVDRVAAAHPGLDLTPAGDVLPELNYRFTDQRNFVRRGVPAIFFSSTGPMEFYHRPSDEPEVVDPTWMERVARLIHHTVLEIAASGRDSEEASPGGPSP